MKWLYLCLFLVPFAGAVEEEATYAVSPLPLTGQVVSQKWVVDTWSYVNEGGSMWWFCGQAAVSTAFNCLRGEYVSRSTGASQLEFFHVKLKLKQNGYSTSEHKEADIDALSAVINIYKGTEFESIKRTTTTRNTAKQMMYDALSANHYIVALSQISIGGTNYGHYMVVYKIHRDPNAATGGTVYYADPYTGAFGNKSFAAFLDGMRDTPTVSRYSFLEISR